MEIARCYDKHGKIWQNMPISAHFPSRTLAAESIGCTFAKYGHISAKNMPYVWQNMAIFSDFRNMAYFGQMAFEMLQYFASNKM